MSRKIATLWDKKDEADEPHPPNNPLAYFAGGSEHSGQQILAPDQAGTNALPVRLWRNGFTVGDGELRDYNTPENKQFLECLKRGETPPELNEKIRDGFIDVKMENKMSEDYTAPQKLQPFSGKGHRLGSPSPQM